MEEINYIVIWEAGCSQYESNVVVDEFKDSKDVHTFINKEGVKDNVIGVYRVSKKFKIEPVEKVITYKLV